MPVEAAAAAAAERPGGVCRGVGAGERGDQPPAAGAGLRARRRHGEAQRQVGRGRRGGGIRYYCYYCVLLF